MSLKELTVQNKTFYLTALVYSETPKESYELILPNLPSHIKKVSVEVIE